MKRTSWWLLTAAILISMSARADNITFADANVKALCVAKWDKNNDGELSTDEAAAVTSFGTVFKGNKSITTFDEMRYFTGVTVIDEYAFSESSIGPTLNIPGTIKEVGDYAFYNCQSLNRVRLEEGVESVGWHAFSGPIKFFSLPSTISTMYSEVIDPYVNAAPGTGMYLPDGDLWTYSYAKTPSVVSETAFFYVSGQSQIVVPPGTIDTYKATTGWNYFWKYYELGDVNRNGTLDDADLEAIISYVNGTEPEGFYADMADINGDSQVDEMDVLLLRNHLHPILMGDVNGDGAVNVLDVTTLVSYVLNEQLEKFVEAAADVNGDGNINTLDVTKLVSIILQSSN